MTYCNVPGVVGTSLRLNPPDSPNDQCVDYGNQRDRCLGSLSECPDGITISFWIKLGFHADNAGHYYVSSGAQTMDSHGIAIYTKENGLSFTQKTLESSWEITLNDVKQGLCVLALKALKYFCINHGDQRVYFKLKSSSLS